MKNIINLILTVLFFVFAGCSSKTNIDTGNTSPEGEVQNEAVEETAEDNDHTVITLKKQPFAFIVKTGGRIMVDRKDIIIVTAKSSGIVKFIDHFLFPGVKISTGQQLFTISGDQLADDNTELNFSQIKADLEQATANYERAKKMISDKIITEEHFLSMKNEYDKALNEFNNLNGTSGKNGKLISSPDKGYIREIYITEGQKVTSGQELASIVIEHNLVLKADVSPEYLNLLPTIEKANFKVGYSKHLFKTDELDGKKISFGKSPGENSFYIPVYFRMKYNPDLIEGTFAEVYLIGKEIKDAIVVPNSSLMEEYGKLFVYVEDFDGDFLKRYIKSGYSNGEYTQVLDGLAENEKIVATGTYQVKLSQMSNSAPAHNH